MPIDNDLIIGYNKTIKKGATAPEREKIMKNYKLTYHGFYGFAYLTRDSEIECIEEAKQIAKARCTPVEILKYDAETDTYRTIGNFTKTMATKS